MSSRKIKRKKIEELIKIKLEKMFFIGFLIARNEMNESANHVVIKKFASARKKKNDSDSFLIFASIAESFPRTTNMATMTEWMESSIETKHNYSCRAHAVIFLFIYSIKSAFH